MAAVKMNWGAGHHEPVQAVKKATHATVASVTGSRFTFRQSGSGIPPKPLFVMSPDCALPLPRCEEYFRDGVNMI
jgi:hypothetical protein